MNGLYIELPLSLRRKWRVTVVDLEVADLERRVLHDALEQRVVDRRIVDEEVAVLHPRFLVMAGREVRRHRDADPWGDLRVDVQVRDGVVEAVADRDELVRVHAVRDAPASRVF